jgi:hypothetical protein
VGEHPIFADLCRDAHEIARAHPHPDAAFLRTQSAWDPFAFVDLCAACLAGRAYCEELARLVQQREWELLFHHCWKHAVGQA